MTDLYRLLPEEMEKMVMELGQPRYRAEQILYPIYNKFPKDISELWQLPTTFRDTLVAEGYTIGCAMGCIFCATGQMGFKRNIKAEEIVAQVIHFARLLQERGEHVTNLVFMGMGEPLANYDETIRAVRLLTHNRGFGIGQRHITISTIGIIAGIDRLADEDLQVGLAISLHAPNDKLRKKLVPTAGPHSVDDLISAGRRYYKKTGRRVTFEYALIEGINDSPEIATELAYLLHGNGSHVNLIPINPTAGDFQRPARRNVIEFERILTSAGVNCTVRVEKGSEISAACGQLRTDIVG